MSLIAGQEVETFLDGSNAKMCGGVHLCLSPYGSPEGRRQDS